MSVESPDKCKRGHADFRARPGGHRECRTCKRNSQRRRRRRAQLAAGRGPR